MYKDLTDDQLINMAKFGDKQARSEMFKRDMKARVAREAETKARYNNGTMLPSDERKMWGCR